MNMPRIFISYGQRDSKLAHAIERELKELGIDAFDSPKEILAGASWRSAIQAAIRRSDAIVLVLASPQPEGAGWMGYELGLAEALGKSIVVLASDDLRDNELPVDLASSPMIRIDAASPKIAARDLADSLSSLQQ